MGYNEYPKQNHNEKGLVAAGVDCPTTFIYVYPERERDKQLWLGCEGEPHNHSPPVDWRLRPKTKANIVAAKIAIPLASIRIFGRVLI